MCVVSMVMDHYRDRWYPMLPQHPFYPPIQDTPPAQEPFDPEKVRQLMEAMKPKPAITPEEVAEFRRLLERAREYDKRMNEPDCELTEKKETLKRIAKQLGVDISFVDEPPSDPAVAGTL